MLSLRIRTTTTIPIEAEGLTPDKMAGKALAEIERMPLQNGNWQVALAELFEISGTNDREEMAIEGDCRHVKWLGAGMTRGRLIVNGDAGMHVGAGMVGGEILLHGAADDCLGAEMKGGFIHVRGNVANGVGSAYPGSRAGMRGGVILIDGSAGANVGATMRRGLIAVGKDCGAVAGMNMIAGSIFIFGAAGAGLGAGMKRGTIAVFGTLPPVLPTFRYDCRYFPAFLDLYLRRLQAWSFPLPPAVLRGCHERYSGDLVGLGKGEVLHWQGASA